MPVTTLDELRSPNPCLNVNQAANILHIICEPKKIGGKLSNCIYLKTLEYFIINLSLTVWFKFNLSLSVWCQLGGCARNDAWMLLCQYNRQSLGISANWYITSWVMGYKIHFNQMLGHHWLISPNYWFIGYNLTSSTLKLPPRQKRFFHNPF